MSFLKSVAFSLFGVASVAVPLLCIASPAAAPRPLPEGQGKVIMQKSCVGCHSLAVVTSKRASSSEWVSIVQQMVARGAAAGDQDIDVLTQYLAKNMSPGAPPYLVPTTVPALADADPVPPDSDATDAEISPTAPNPSGIHVNVNTASIRQLQAALSLTREEAETLSQCRRQNNGFRDWQQVGEVPGVPADKIIEYRDRLIF